MLWAAWPVRMRFSSSRKAMSRIRGSEFPLSWRLCTICSRARASADLLAMRLWAPEVTGSPCLRCDSDLPFRSAEQPEARPAAARGVGKGTLWVDPRAVPHASGDRPVPAGSRCLSLLRQSLACLGALLTQGRWWTRGWLRPRLGSYKLPAVRALAQGP